MPYAVVCAERREARGSSHVGVLVRVRALLNGTF